jgi:GTP-binding protein EngB required for normal cell division
MTSPARPEPVQDHASGPPLNENHIRRLQATFWYVDDLLRGIEALTHPDPSPFVRERPDLSLRGYGALQPSAAAEITALSADLQNLMRRGKALLGEQEEGGLAGQVASLAGPAGEALRRLLAVSTARGLTEIRPLISAAAERAAATTLDVGVFGRVSSGKSSLINRLVGEAVLPVGATPVTAVPLRVSRGPHAVEVRFRDGKTEQIPLSALPGLATEEKNPQNAKGVRSIEVTVPGAPPGLRLLDTPGVGSLTSSGSAQAFAWLPRCDFGLVLVAAGTPLGRDETALVSGLRNAGIDCRVVLSKADLLDAADVERTRAYVAGELVPLLGPDETVDVRAVSTRAEHAEGLDALRAEVLLPLARDHAGKATDALRARLHRLVALTAASLNGGPPAGDAVAIDFEKRRGAAAEAVGKTTDALASSAKRVLEDAAEAVAACWARGEDGAAAARAVIVSAAGRGLSAVREAVDLARSHAGEGDEASARRLPPLFDPEFLDAVKTLPPPRLVPGLLRRGRAQGAVAALLPFLDQALARYAARLEAWGEGALEELRPAGGPPAATDARSPELAGLETLIALVASSALAQPDPEEPR